MTQQEAVKFLKISVRSLQRYVKSERLSVRYEAGKTRSVPIYDPKEIETLKAELFFRPVYPQSQTNSDQSQKKPFGFRIAPEELSKLTEEGAKYGMSAGEYARWLVHVGLEGALEGEVQALRSEVTTLKQQILSLKRAFRNFQADYMETIEIVLGVAGMSEEEAHLWVEENLRSS